MEWGTAALAAWAELLGLERLVGVQVIVSQDSPLCRYGWIGILGLKGTITAAVPDPDLVGVLAEALGGLSAEEAVQLEVIEPRLPATRSVVGPAHLFYPPFEHVGINAAPVGELSRDDLNEVVGAVTPDELDESGLLEVSGPLFGSWTPAGDLAAVSGYSRWPNGVAHLSVLTGRAHRRQGHARFASSLAILHAAHLGLLPQWRARPPGSQALAHSLGLIHHGAQLNLEPA